MNHLINELLRDVRRAFAGLAYAHQGEHLPMRDKTAALGPSDPPTPLCPLPGAEPPPRATGRRQVLLAVEGGVPLQAVRYAAGACRRLDADLVVIAGPGDHLTLLGEQLHAALPDTVPQWWVWQTGGELTAAVTAYVQRQAAVLFVVVDGGDALARRMAPGRGRRTPWSAAVPCVVVNDGRAPATERRRQAKTESGRGRAARLNHTSG